MSGKNPHNNEYVEYIQRAINSICPYGNNEQLKRLYHAGFLASILADLMLDDNRNYYKFKARIERLQQRNKEL